MWEAVIVPNTRVGPGLRFRYQIWHDWGSGGMELSEYRHADEPIRIGRRFRVSGFVMKKETGSLGLNRSVFPEDFMEDRDQGVAEKREPL